jgi:hypothetical protein
LTGKWADVERHAKLNGFNLLETPGALGRCSNGAVLREGRKGNKRKVVSKKHRQATAKR